MPKQFPATAAQHPAVRLRAQVNCIIDYGQRFPPYLAFLMLPQRALPNHSAPPCRMANPLRATARTSTVFSCVRRAATTMATAAAATATALTMGTTLTITAWTTDQCMSTVDTQMTAITIWMIRLALSSIWRLTLSHPRPRSKSACNLYTHHTEFY